MKNHKEIIHGVYSPKKERVSFWYWIAIAIIFLIMSHAEYLSLTN